jgi:hypothetical protein
LGWSTEKFEVLAAKVAEEIRIQKVRAYVEM